LPANDGVEIGIRTGEIKAVTEHEHVGNLEADETKRRRQDPASALVQQRAHLERRRLPSTRTISG